MKFIAHFTYKSCQSNKTSYSTNIANTGAQNGKVHRVMPKKS